MTIRNYFNNCIAERYDLLAPPHPLSRSNSSSDFFLDADKEEDP